MVRLPPRLRPLFPYLKPTYHRATGVVSPLSRALGRVQDGRAPTGVVLDLAEAARASSGRCIEVCPELGASRLVVPAGAGARARAMPDAAVPPVRLAELPGGRVLGPHAAVVSSRGDLVDEVSRYFDTTAPGQHPVFLRPWPGRPREIAGRLGVLASRGDRNYFHFLLDVLPRLAVARARPEIPEPDLWYVPAALPFQRELLDLVGLPVERRVDSSVFGHVRAETLVVPGVPSIRTQVPPWTVDWLRQQLLPGAAAQGPGRRLYLTRGTAANNRRVLNEPEVIAILERRGFEVVDPGRLSVREQIELFSQASVVVGPHGAGLANLVFVPAGTVVVEIFPATRVLPDAYWRMARAVPGVDHRYVTGRGVRARSVQQVLVRDILVDTSALARIVDRSYERD